MQLTIEVLPAPLGPIIENSSPSWTPKVTSVSARTPPKRSDTPRTSKACSTHSLHPGASSALCFGVGADEINPVHHDGAICFTGWSRSTVALVAGAVRARDRTSLDPAPADFGIRLQGRSGAKACAAAGRPPALDLGGPAVA